MTFKVVHNFETAFKMKLACMTELQFRESENDKVWVYKTRELVSLVELYGIVLMVVCQKLVQSLQPDTNQIDGELTT